MARAIFVTNQQQAHILRDNEGEIGRFRDTYNNVVEADDGKKRRDINKPSLWVMVLTDETKIERAKKYPGFGKTFKETTTEPVFHTLSSLKQMGGEAPQHNFNQVQNSQETDELKEYGKLFAEVCGAGGKILKSADPQKAQRFKELQEKYELSENLAETV